MSSISDRIHIATASRFLCERFLGDLVGLDAEGRNELGADFSEESWDGESFLLYLPGKFEISTIALVDEQVKGFWIASAKSVRPHRAHTHRVFVAPAYRRRGIAGGLAKATEDRAQQMELDRMTIWVSPSNSWAEGLYRSLGYARTRCHGGRVLMEKSLCG